MKHWRAHKYIWIAAAVVALALAGAVEWLLNKPPTADCAAAPADHNVPEIRATKVVVQPWLGLHHVYGIFMVPNRYRHNRKYEVTLVVRGFDRSFALGERSDNLYAANAFGEPGHYLLRSYVPTRVALWFLVNGLFGDFRRPCNWTLVFVERSS